MDIIHPLPLNTVVISKKPPCSCNPGGSWTETKGAVRKIIQNHSGTWYFLSSGSTVSAAWIKEVLPQ